MKQTFNNPLSALQFLYPQYKNNMNYNAWSDPYTNIGSIQTHTNGLSNEANLRLGDYTLTSVSAWRHFDFHPNNSDGNFGIQAIDNNISGYDVGVNQYSEEIRLSSPTGEKFDWTAGNYFLREMIKSDDRMQFGPDAVSLLNLNATGTGANQSALLNGVEADLYGTAAITTIAQFLQGTYHYDEHAALTLGLRNSYEIRSSSDNGYYFGGASLANGLGSLTAQQAQNLRKDYVISEITGTDFDIDGVQRTDSISFLINPSYKFNDNFTAYLDVARGVKSGAANTTAVPYFNTAIAPTAANGYAAYGQLGEMNPITKPETSLDYELGFKSNWLDNHFQVNGNAYWNDIYNFQATLVDYLPYTTSSGSTAYATKNYLGNVPQVRLAGFELEGRYSPIDNLWINFAGAYNGAWYVSFPDAPPPADYVASGAAYKSVNLSGARVPNVTPYTFTIGANYEYAAGSYLGQNWKGYVYGNQFFKSTTLFSLDASYTNSVLKQGSYSVFNAGFGFKSTDNKYDIVVWAKNLFNRQAFQNLALSASAGNAPGVLQWIDPLTVGVTFRTKF